MVQLQVLRLAPEAGRFGLVHLAGRDPFGGLTYSIRPPRIKELPRPTVPCFWFSSLASPLRRPSVFRASSSPFSDVEMPSSCASKPELRIGSGPDSAIAS